MIISPLGIFFVFLFGLFIGIALNLDSANIDLKSKDGKSYDKNKEDLPYYNDYPQYYGDYDE